MHGSLNYKLPLPEQLYTETDDGSLSERYVVEQIERRRAELAIASSRGHRGRPVGRGSLARILCRPVLRLLVRLSVGNFGN